MIEAVRHSALLEPFLRPLAGSALQRAMLQRPETVGVLVWPYMCASWSPAERLRRVVGHFEAVESRVPALDLDADASLELVSLGDVAPGLKVVLDRPPWFMREGQLALNLFMDDTRIYSLAFSVNLDGESLVVHVGAIQGVAAEGIQHDYKELTKALHGMRPRDFLVELLRTLCRCIGAAAILAVADGSRQHRSRYFGEAKAEKLSLNYDDIWTERGGVHDASPDFFRLDTETPVRSLDEVPSKKRAMYRRRYELLLVVEDRLKQGLTHTKPVMLDPSQHGAAPDALAA